jgi:hypothetical protein
MPVFFASILDNFVQLRPDKVLQSMSERQTFWVREEYGRI